MKRCPECLEVLWAGGDTHPDYEKCRSIARLDNSMMLSTLLSAQSALRDGGEVSGARDAYAIEAAIDVLIELVRRQSLPTPSPRG